MSDSCHALPSMPEAMQSYTNSIVNPMVQFSLFDNVPQEDDEFLTKQVITYIGNKRSLLPFIGQGVQIVKSRLGKDKLDCLDLFSGSGIVARYLKMHSTRLVVNDLEAYSRITNECFLANRKDVPEGLLQEGLRRIEDKTNFELIPGFISELYAPADDEKIAKGDRAFYTRRNASYIDTVRTAIESEQPELQRFYIAPLLASASVHANTAGVFKGFYKNADGVGQFGGNGRDALSRILKPIKLELPRFSRFESDLQVFQDDANSLVKQLNGDLFDLAYIDPPYNQHPYGSNYFMLNLIASNQRPPSVSRISGIPEDWNRSPYYRRSESEAVLFDVISNCPAKFVLLSYNSEGFIRSSRLTDELNRLGRVTTFEIRHNTFRGSRNLSDRPMHVTEFLYLLEKTHG